MTIEIAPGITAEGPAGTAEIRWGYHIAARLGPWYLQRDGTLTATIVDGDPLRLTQPGLTFTVLRQRGQPWTWPVIELSITDDRLSATLGPKASIH